MEFESQFIRIGQVQLQYYGIIIVAAMIMATFVGVNLAKRFGRDPEHIYGALTWAIIPGIIMARMWFVAFPPVTSTNIFVPEEYNYALQIDDLVDESGAFTFDLTPGLTFADIEDGSALDSAGLQLNDRVRSVRVGDAAEATPVFDTTALNNVLSGVDSGTEVRLTVDRQVPKDRNWYLRNFFDLDSGAIAIWSGGLSIFGALLGGVAGAYIYFRRNGLHVPAWLDIAAICIPLGQAVGRWANYVNQELFGDLVSSNFPLALRIPEDIGRQALRAAEGLPQNAPISRDLLNSSLFDSAGNFVLTFHPLFLYESLWSLAAFGVLMWLYLNHRDRFRPGDFFLMFIVQYSFIRFMLEFLRLEVTLVNGVNVSQVVTAVAGLIALVLLVVRLAGRGSDPRRYDEIAPPEPPVEDPKAKDKKADKPAKRTRKPKEAEAPKSEDAPPATDTTS